MAPTLAEFAASLAGRSGNRGKIRRFPRPGAPARLTAGQICKITQLACEKPEENGQPISQWTGREIADEVIRRGIVDQISARHAVRLLKRGGS